MNPEPQSLGKKEAHVFFGFRVVGFLGLRVQGFRVSALGLRV